MPADVRAMSDRQWHAHIRASLPGCDAAWVREFSAVFDESIDTKRMEGPGGAPMEMHRLSIRCSSGQFERYDFFVSAMLNKDEASYAGTFFIFGCNRDHQELMDFSVSMAQRFLARNQMRVEDGVPSFEWDDEDGADKQALNLLYLVGDEIGNAFEFEEN